MPRTGKIFLPEPPAIPKEPIFGLALSGGGSRAAAFHSGTVRGLSEVDLLDQVNTVSSVSGGSLFAGAWMAARWKGYRLSTFLDRIMRELADGFIARSITLRSWRLILPSYTRSNLLAETFDRTLMYGMRLRDLPDCPVLCINTSVMNTGQVGKFSRDGFSSTGIQAPGEAQGDSNPIIPLPDFPVALAAAASAAFPVGLPPVYLMRGEHIPEGWGGESLADHRRFALIDGGVLENLGVQTLLKSERFGAWNLLISDAGQAEEPWNPKGIANSVRGAIVGMVSFPILERVANMMNSKQNRHMRLGAFGELERSWLVDSLRTGILQVGLAEYLSGQPTLARRLVLFVRLNQTMRDLLKRIPRWRLRELAARSSQLLPDRLPTATLLKRLGVQLDRALEIHAALGGDARIEELNRISTHFTALSKHEIEDLAAHACWQVHAMRALYL